MVEPVNLQAGERPTGALDSRARSALVGRVQIPRRWLERVLERIDAELIPELVRTLAGGRVIQIVAVPQAEAAGDRSVSPGPGPKARARDEVLPRAFDSRATQRRTGAAR